MTKHPPSAHRRGFTLVEILLSLGLLMLVLAAAYSALNLFRLVTTAGREDAERSQLARAIERRITADIRCVLYREPEPESIPSEPAAGLVTQSSGGAAEDPEELTTAPATSASTESDVTAITDPAEAYATQKYGVFGDTTTLVLHVDKPRRPSLLESAPTSTLATTVMPTTTSQSDLRSVSYFLAIAGAGGLQGAVGNTAAGGTAAFSMEQGLQGLARLDGDRLALQQADEAGEADALAQDAELIAREVTELRFRYFDGATWLDTWDSASMKAVPRAIEVTMRIDVHASKEKSKSTFGPTAAVRSADLYRFVVALPLSDPTLGLEL
jgi:type II secretory pathway pseudopilin PulG